MAKKQFLKIEFANISKYISQIEKLGIASEGICKAAVYDGAAIAINAAKESLRNSVSEEATGSLEKSMGLAGMTEKDGYIYTKIGFRKDYDDKGTPQVLKARVLENGTKNGTHKPTRFISRAMKKCKRAVETQIEVTINDRISKIVK